MLLAATLAACGNSANVIGSGAATAAVSAVAADVPVVNGNPAATVMVGQTYSFTPSATDPQSKTLSYSITNMPSWATFEVSTGALTGTPTAADVGSYDSITVSVSNGGTPVALPTFAITVLSAANSATLTWVAPTENTDGTPLTDLAGYRINYGPSEDQMTETVQIPDATAVTYEIDNLSAGTWYFEAVAYTTENVESAASTVASKAID